MQNVAVPLGGDANAVKKYADEMQKIKKQVKKCCCQTRRSTDHTSMMYWL